ncbi:MAG: PilZ domain-containing protein [Nitrospirae bacterium]|nr:PilZ domain-containing protein [Nitrospirota bacterium]
MERRQFNRKRVYLSAERISGNADRSIFIENISERGIQIITAPAESIIEFSPGTPIDLKFVLSNGEIIDLYCIVKWSYHNTPPDDATTTIGMEVVDPPSRYREFVKTQLPAAPVYS